MSRAPARRLQDAQFAMDAWDRTTSNTVDALWPATYSVGPKHVPLAHWRLAVAYAQGRHETTRETAQRLSDYVQVWQERYGEPPTLIPETLAGTS